MRSLFQQGQQEKAPRQREARSASAVALARAGVLLTGAAHASRDVGDMDITELVEVRLSPFDVASHLDRGYRTFNAVSGSRFDAPIHKLPFAIQAFSESFIVDQKPVNLFDIARYSPGVTYRSNDFNEGSANLAIRGFAVSQSPGTKSPQPRFAGVADVSYGSYGQYQAQAELTGPLSNTLFFRVAASYDQDLHYWEPYDAHSSTIAPSLLWKPSERFSLSLKYEGLPPQVMQKPGYGRRAVSCRRPKIPIAPVRMRLVCLTTGTACPTSTIAAATPAAPWRGPTCSSTSTGTFVPATRARSTPSTWCSPATSA